MQEKNLELVNKILLKFNNLGKVHDYVIIDNMLYLSCYIKTDSPYFLVIRGGSVLYKKYDYMNYISDFNSEGYGNGFVIIDLDYWEIVKVFYFKDTLNYDWPVQISFHSNDFLVLNYEELSYVLYLSDLTIDEIGASSYKVYQPYIIGLPYFGYHCEEQLFLLDTTTRKKVDLYNVFSNVNINEWSANNLFIENGKLVCVNSKRFEEYVVPINLLLGYGEVPKSDYSFVDEVYNIKTIDEILPYSGFTLGEMASWLGHIKNERCSYIGKLLNFAKNYMQKNKIVELAQLTASQINKLFGAFDVIVPVPPSDLSRQFQPLHELVKKISEIINVPYDMEYLLTKNQYPIKLIEDRDKRRKILDESLYLNDVDKYRDKKILLVDDHIFRGDTINACISKCRCSDIFVLVIARNYELSEFDLTDYESSDSDLLSY